MTTKVQSLLNAIQNLRDAQIYYENNGKKDRIYLENLNELGLAYMELPGDDRTVNLNTAVAYFNKVLESDNIGEYPKIQAACYNNLGMAYSRYQTPDSETALKTSLEFFQKALEFYRAESMSNEYARAKNNLGTVYVDLMEWDGRLADAAIKCFEDAVLAWEQTDKNDEFLASCYINAAQAVLHSPSRSDEQRQTDSLAYAERALGLLNDDSSPAKRAGAHESMAGAYIAAGPRHSLDNALQELEQALRWMTPSTYPNEVRRLQQSLGDLYLSLDDWENAELCYEQALHAHNMLFNAANFATGRFAEISAAPNLYPHSAYALAKMGAYEQAIVRLEGGKTRVMAERLRLADQDLGEVPNADRQAYLSNRAEISDQEQLLQEMDTSWGVARSTASPDALDKLRKKLKAAHLRRLDLIEHIRETVPGFLGADWQPQRLYKAAPTLGVMVVPIFTTEGSALIVIPGGIRKLQAEHILWLDHLKKNTIDELLYGTKGVDSSDGWLPVYNDFQLNRSRLSEERWHRAIDQIGKDLWEIMLGPLHHHLLEIGLTQGSTVLFIPQGGLGLLPLHAAWREQDSTRRYFVDDWAVRYSPSIEVAFTCHERLFRLDQRQSPSVLTVADTRCNLAFALEEGEMVAELFSQRSLLKGKDATLSRIKALAGCCDYMHFACHGYYDVRDPLRSGLELAGKDFLDVREIIDGLELSNAPLVTLSACETGISDVHLAPDEYIGLSAAFLTSGAAAVVSSLWLVDDLSTRLLMERFYDARLREGLTPAEALRVAQCWLRTQGGIYSHPYFWAPFTVYGG